MSEEAFVARPSTVRLALMLLLASGFVAIGLWIAGTFGPPPRPAMAWSGWLAAGFFGLCGAAIVARLFDRDDQLRISARGIRWKPWSDETIPWAAIEEVSVWSHRGQRFIVLRLREPARHRSTRPLRRLAALNRPLTGGDIAISLAGTDRRLREALAALERFGGC